jgi:uncharacterized protein
MTKIALGLIMTFTALALVACGSSAPANFYLLQARPATSFQGPATDAAEEISIGIGPLELPEYLDRPQMVTRSKGNSVKVHEFERWAEPLVEGVSRVVSDNLADLLLSEQIAIHPWHSPLKVDYRLSLTFTRFEGAADGSISLAGRWVFYNTEKNKVILRQPFKLSRTAASQRVEALVDGQNQLLAELCEGIADAVTRVVASWENQPLECSGNTKQ